MAVYTEINPEELVAFVALYDIGDVLWAKGIEEGIENSNYLLKTTTGLFVLTLYEKRVKASDLPFFLGLKEHLAAKGIACPIPLRSQEGHIFHYLCSRPAAIVTFLNGMCPRSIKEYHCAQLGATLAQLHLAGSDFAMNRSNDLSINSWRLLLAESISSGDIFEPGLGSELEDEIIFLEKNWPKELPYGVIHADLFPDNVFFRYGKITGLIDFYFACKDMLAYDIAVCLNAWCFDLDGRFDVAKSQRMLTAYTDIRPFSVAEKVAMPILARGAAIRFLLTRLYDWLHTPPDALVRKKDPLEYREKLRFHQLVNGPADYGFY